MGDGTAPWSAIVAHPTSKKPGNPSTTMEPRLISSSTSTAPASRMMEMSPAPTSASNETAAYVLETPPDTLPRHLDATMQNGNLPRLNSRRRPGATALPRNPISPPRHPAQDQNNRCDQSGRQSTMSPPQIASSSQRADRQETRSTIPTAAKPARCAPKKRRMITATPRPHLPP